MADHVNRHLLSTYARYLPNYLRYPNPTTSATSTLRFTNLVPRCRTYITRVTHFDQTLSSTPPTPDPPPRFPTPITYPSPLGRPTRHPPLVAPLRLIRTHLPPYTHSPPANLPSQPSVISTPAPTLARGSRGSPSPLRRRSLAADPSVLPPPPPPPCLPAHLSHVLRGPLPTLPNTCALHPRPVFAPMPIPFRLVTLSSPRLRLGTPVPSSPPAPSPPARNPPCAFRPSVVATLISPAFPCASSAHPSRPSPPLRRLTRLHCHTHPSGSNVCSSCPCSPVSNVCPLCPPPRFPPPGMPPPRLRLHVRPVPLLCPLRANISVLAPASRPARQRERTNLLCAGTAILSRIHLRRSAHLHARTPVPPRFHRAAPSLAGWLRRRKTPCISYTSLVRRVPPPPHHRIVCPHPPPRGHPCTVAIASRTRRSAPSPRYAGLLRAVFSLHLGLCSVHPSSTMYGVPRLPYPRTRRLEHTHA
ncbi:hypothetical protein B0H14DRAFT_3888801 [Mycena olivaceomarginata]|nr:hypothetical protein B0H14DRAFT_3888801 [Mycena olivaceomarginata]